MGFFTDTLSGSGTEYYLALAAVIIAVLVRSRASAFHDDALVGGLGCKDRSGLLGPADYDLPPFRLGIVEAYTHTLYTLCDPPDCTVLLAVLLHCRPESDQLKKGTRACSASQPGQGAPSPTPPTPPLLPLPSRMHQLSVARCKFEAWRLPAIREGNTRGLALFLSQRGTMLRSM